MKKYIKFSVLLCCTSLWVYIIFSIGFVEYLIKSDRMLGYYGDNSIQSSSMYLPIENNRKLFLYSVENVWNLWNNVKMELFWSFLYPNVPWMSHSKYYRFIDIPSSNLMFKEWKLWLSIDLRNTYTDKVWNNSIFSKTLSDMTQSFGEPKVFDNFGSTFYFWKKWNESLVLVQYETIQHEKQIRISLQDTRLTDQAGLAITELPKKISPLLILSRFGFMKKVWYLQE